MEPIKVALCPECENCPCVEVDDKEVRIGEGRNKVTLTHPEWNDLVARIRRAELKPV